MTSISMTAVSVSFLILELLIIAVSTLIGYRRGMGRSIVRVVYLAVIGVVSFFLARHIAFSLSDSIMAIAHGMFPEDIRVMVESAPDLEVLVINLAGALLAPVIFAMLFGILQLLTLIFFKTISGKLVSAICRKEEKAAWSNWAGAGVGLVAGFAIAAVILSPIFTIVYVVDNTPDETITIFAEALEENGSPSVQAQVAPANVLKAHPSALFLTKSPFTVSSVSPWLKPLSQALTAYDVPSTDGDHDTAADVLPILFSTAGDALYSYNVTAHNGGTANDALTNAAAAVIPHLNDAPTVKKMVTDALTAMGKVLQSGESVMGIELPASDNAILKSMIDNLVDTLAHTTPETVEANMLTLFGAPTISYGADTDTTYDPSASANTGLLSTMTKLDKDDPMGSLAGEGMSDVLSDAIVSIAENDNMDAVLDDVRNYAIDKIEAANVDLADQKYQTLYEDINDKITTQLSQHAVNPEATVKEAAEELAPTINEIFEEYEIPVSEVEADIVSTCIAKEFMNEEYLTDGTLDISIADIMDFFGITEDQIPDWAH